LVAAMAERILMNEYKALAKEDWVNIEVRPAYYMYMLGCGTGL
jgi:hypothetical protein